jgi:hypothetical protein
METGESNASRHCTRSRASRDRKRTGQSPEVEMSDRTRDHLKALGYLK